jgi:hypothetical protein
MLVCKKCNSAIVARDKIPNARHRNYVCPFCGTSINTFNIKNYLIGFFALFFLWALSFFTHHIGEGNLVWNQENKSSFHMGSLFIVFSAYSIYELVKEKTEIKVFKPNKWLIIGVINVLLLLNEIYIVASRVWGL